MGDDVTRACPACGADLSELVKQAFEAGVEAGAAGRRLEDLDDRPPGRDLIDRIYDWIDPSR